MVIFFLSPVESCGGGHGTSSREEGVCPSSPKAKRNMTMAIFLPASVERCGGDHGLLEKGEVCPSYSYDEEKDDHGPLPLFLSGEL